MEIAAPAARLLLYVGAAIAIGRGTLTFLDADGEQERGAGGTPAAVQRALQVGTGALLIAPALLLWLQQQALELPWNEMTGLLRDTTWGRGWTQLAMTCAATAVFLPLRMTRTTSLLLIMAALGVAVAMGGLGHAAADEQWPLLSRLLDATHVAGMGAWIGGLFLMVLAGSGDGRTGESGPSATEWQRYSRTATVMAPVTVLSGVGSAWRRVGASAPLEILASDYGRLLLLKTISVIAILALGYTQRRRIASSAPVARTVVRREVTIALAVLVATAWLTGLEPPTPE